MSVEKINLKERVELELLEDMPSCYKKKGDKIKSHPKNVEYLTKTIKVAKLVK